MAPLIMAIPVLPEKVEQARQFFGEKAGPRSGELDAVNRRNGLTAEVWQLQDTPQGPLLLGYVEVPNLARFLHDYATMTGAFERWEKQQFKEITGVDFNEPATGPLPETLFDWRA